MLKFEHNKISRFKVVALSAGHVNKGEVDLSKYVGEVCNYLLSKYSDSQSFVWSNFVDLVVELPNLLKQVEEKTGLQTSEKVTSIGKLCWLIANYHSSKFDAFNKRFFGSNKAPMSDYIPKVKSSVDIIYLPISGHENPDVDSVVSVIMMSYLMFQTGDKRLMVRPCYEGILQEEVGHYVDSVLGRKGFTDAFFTNLNDNPFVCAKRKMITSAHLPVVTPEMNYLEATKSVLKYKPGLRVLMPIVDAEGNYKGCLRHVEREEFLMTEIIKNKNLQELTVADALAWKNIYKSTREKVPEDIQFELDVEMDSAMQIILEKVYAVPVVSDDNKFAGVVTQAEYYKENIGLIMVDTQEPTLSLKAINPKLVVKKDHHENKGGLSNGVSIGGNSSTVAMILKDYLQFRRNVSFPAKLARLGLGAMLIDSNMKERFIDQDEYLFDDVAAYCLAVEQGVSYGANFHESFRYQKDKEDIQQEEISRYRSIQADVFRDKFLNNRNSLYDAGDVKDYKKEYGLDVIAWQWELNKDLLSIHLSKAKDVPLELAEKTLEKRKSFGILLVTPTDREDMEKQADSMLVFGKVKKDLQKLMAYWKQNLVDSVTGNRIFQSEFEYTISEVKDTRGIVGYCAKIDFSKNANFNSRKHSVLKTLLAYF
ncbi:MAG: DHH family phosphoesterase [Candidatus Margulisbacteria bacterium]|nr:DHH family phosphoesterase [Candidatus Margulisiibacteriota bacterium]